MNWQARLQQAADEFNARLVEEQQLERQLTHARELRLQALGKAQMMQELFQEHLESESLAASGNGHGDQAAIASPVEVTAPDNAGE